MIKAILVTGGSSGIGRQLCADLLAEGHTVVSLSRRPCPIDNDNLHSVCVDLADRQATNEAITPLFKQFAITTIVHNAGLIKAARLPEVQLADLDVLTEVHLACVMQLMQAALPHFTEQRYGRVVLVSSRAALGMVGRSNYSATKSALFGLARTWALELAALGVTVNVVAPGPIRTEMLYEVITPGSPQEQALVDKIPLGRLGESDDVIQAIKFFIAPSNSFVTGQILYVCGGSSLGSLAL